MCWYPASCEPNQIAACDFRGPDKKHYKGLQKGGEETIWHPSHWPGCLVVVGVAGVGVVWWWRWWWGWGRGRKNTSLGTWPGFGIITRHGARGVRDHGGLNPKWQRGFSDQHQHVTTRVETSTLNDMSWERKSNWGCCFKGWRVNRWHNRNFRKWW